MKKTLMACAVLSTLGFVGGCGQSEQPVEPAQVVEAPDTSGVIERQVQVAITEGTNLAVTVDGAGNRVISLQGSLFFLPADGAPARALTDAYYDAREPSFSADGQHVVFQGYRNGNWDIWQVAVSGGGAPTAITEDGYDDREPSFSADGGRVVFSSDRSGRYDIWAIDLASGALTQLSESPLNAYAPSWSASGHLSYAEQGARGAMLMVLNADGSRQMLAERAGTISGVQWSPNETHIAYQLQDARGMSMQVLELGANNSSMLSSPGADVFPFKAVWLSDDKLAYAVDGKVMRQALADGQPEDWPFLINLTLTRHDYPRRERSYDASEVRPALGIGSPRISNDGQHIYFSALGDLWHWQPQVQALTQLTNDPAADHSPALSPDGNRLAFVSDSSGQLGLYVMDLSTQSTEQLNVAAQQIGNPTWSPDGLELAFFVDVPGNPLGGQLVRLNLESGEMQKVLEPMPAQPVSYSGDGSRIAVTQLNTYSTRYREGLYELVVVDLEDQSTSTISPEPHRSIVHAGLTADGAMTYVEGGLLYRLELDADYKPLEKGLPITQTLTDTPNWSANGAHLVYLAGDRLQHMDKASGVVTDVTPVLNYQLDTSDESYVLRVGRVVTGVDEDYLLDQDIVVSGNRITGIGPQTDHGDLPVVDLADKTIMPGLFEMHAHMGETSEVQGRVWLSFGITSVRDPGANPYTAKERQEAWDSGRRVGPRTYITGYLTDGNRVFYSMAEGIVSEAHLQRAFERTAALGLDFVKTYVRLPDHWQKQVVDFAHGMGIPVSSHELYPAVAHGMDHVEHIGGTSRRGYQPKVSRLGHSYDDVITLLSKSGMGITPTAVLPGFAVIVTEEPDWFETPQFEAFYGAPARQAYEGMATRFGGGSADYAKANGGLLRALTEQDALLVTGTDSPFVPYGAGLHAEFRLYARAGVAPIDVLRQATLNSAKAAGVDADLGSIETGKLADMVVVDGDPLANVGDWDDVVMTIKNGHRYPLEELLTPTR